MIERTEAPSAPAAPARTWDVAIVGPAMSASRSRTRSRSPAVPCCSSTSSMTSSTRSTAASRIEDVRADQLGPLVAAGRISASTDYDGLRDADAILIALHRRRSRRSSASPTCRSSCTRRARSPRGCKGPARRARIDDYPARHGSSCCRCSGGSGLRVGKDFNLAFSPERVDPGSSWDARASAESGRRDRKAVHDARRGALPRGDQPGACRLVPEAAELTKLLEHLPVGQHRARQRARTARRANGHRRLGSGRRRRDEAVRVHELQAWAGPRRSLHPDRSLLPDVESARVRLHDGVHRARRSHQRVDAGLLPLADLAGAEPREAGSR